MADSGVWRVMQDVLKKQFPNARITSTYRAGSTGSGGTPDWHSKGNAIDVGSPNMTIFNWIAANYPDSAELIYTPAGSAQIKNGAKHKYSASVAAGHFNHIHWAMASAPGSGGRVVTVADSSGGGDSVLESLNPLQPLFDFVSFVTDPGTWVRIGLGILGLALLIIGFLQLTKVPSALKGVIPSGR